MSMAKCLRSAGPTVRDDHIAGNRRNIPVFCDTMGAMSLLVAAPETAESVRHFGHASEAAHHFVEQLAQGRPGRFRQVRVYRRRGDALVAEEHLHDAGVHLSLEEPG